ncbi:MAG TPA: hypothetical protein DCS93_38225 [Microscillaceae bacterium]|nr:hypothetical protein [Microscillaceae bacterium]
MAGTPSSPFITECTVERTLVRKFSKVNLYKIGWSELPQYTQFVFDIYRNTVTDEKPWDLTQEDLATMYREDQTYFPHSVYFGFMNSNYELVGTMKATQKTDLVLLPAEVEYGIDIKQLSKAFHTNPDNIWHCGRLAVNKQKAKIAGVGSRSLFLELLFQSFQHITRRPGAIFLAEADKRVYDLFHLVGVPMQQIAKGKTYLGSETYPVVISHEGMLAWLEHYTCHLDQVLRKSSSFCSWD